MKKRGKFQAKWRLNGDRKYQVQIMEKDHSLSKDEERKGHDEIQKATDKHVAEVDKIVQGKEKDVLEG